MSDSKITFCISIMNKTLNYLELAVQSIIDNAKYGKNSNFIIYYEHEDEENVDKFHEWFIKKQKKFSGFQLKGGNDIENKDKKNKKYYSGIGGGMNFCAEQATTEYIMFVHSDMYVSKNFDDECLNIFKKYPNEKLWVNPYRFQPNLFDEESRPGTMVFPYKEFGYKYNNFNKEYFLQFAEEFSKLNPNVEYEKGEGVSGLIRKKDWDDIGGNDPVFHPAYWEDVDIFLRCQLFGMKFIVTTNSVVFHFGSRSANSNFPDDSLILPNEKAIRSQRSINNEYNSRNAFLKKWNFLPVLNKDGFVTFPPNINKENYKELIKLKI